MTLYTKAGCHPQPLPAADQRIEDGFTLTPLAGHPDAITACGWTPAPVAPALDVEIEQLGWDGAAWKVEPMPAEVLAARRAAVATALTAAIVERRDDVFRGGFAPKAGPLVGHRLDLRPGTDDRTNWLASQAAYGDAVANGFGDVVNATFRTVDNQTVHVTYDDAKAVLLAMFTWANAVMAVSWDKKDAIDRGEAIDLDDGWPA